MGHISRGDRKKKTGNGYIIMILNFLYQNDEVAETYLSNCLPSLSFHGSAMKVARRLLEGFFHLVAGNMD